MGSAWRAAVGDRPTIGPMDAVTTAEHTDATVENADSEKGEPETAEPMLVEELLVEEVSIDGMCGVY